jgi:nicotinate-nucleotide adenylyltransferase
MATLRLGVFGGTFDPPHYGHLLLAEQARERLGLERVLWVPAGDPWRKAGTTITPAEHRLAMLRLALEGNDAFEISTIELDRAGPSYTVDTLATLHDEFPAHELIVLLGADALQDVPNWHEAPRLIGLALLGATARAGSQPSDAELEALLPGLSRRVVWFEMPRCDISATDLRERAAAGRSLRDLVPPAVEAYIHQHKLYGRF